MAGYYERRKSKAAIWCRRLAVIAAPVLILTIYLHRSGGITTEQAFWLIAFGIAILLASLVFGLRAAADLWEKGYQGGKATVNGIVLAILLLIPFGVQMFKALEHPQLNDVSTDVINPPMLLAPVNDGDRTVRETAGTSEIYDDFAARQIVANYPELIGRRYDAPQERVAKSVVDLLKRWRWPVVASLNLPDLEPKEETGEEDLAGSEEELEELAENAAEEGTALPEILLQVQAKSFIMKLPSHIVIRLSEIENSTLVDMRSLSTWGRHDFGGNADHITDFLTELDVVLAGLAGEG